MRTEPGSDEMFGTVISNAESCVMAIAPGGRF